MSPKDSNSAPSRSFTSRLKYHNSELLKADAAATPKPFETAFLLLDNFSLAAFTAAVDALVTANLLTPSQLYQVHTLSLQQDLVRSDLGIDISVDNTLSQVEAKHYDLIFVCGGYRTSLVPQPKLISFLQAAAKHNCAVGGIWNGSFYLAQAGILEGYSCTIHPENRALLEENNPTVSLSSMPIVIDRDRFSCAGASSAMEMMLGVVNITYSEDLIRGIKEILICDKIGENPNKPMLSENHSTLPDSLQMILSLMQNNIDEPLSMQEIARYAGLSRRHIERLFTRHMDTTPSRYYLELRITRARQLLQQSNKSIADIAVACGFVSTTHFSHCFKDYFGCSPTQARQQR